MKKALIGIVLLAVLAAGGLAVVNFALDRTQRTAQTVAEPVREIVVKSGAGDVDLVPAGGRIEVRQTRHYVLGKPNVKLTVKDGVLTLDSDSDCAAIVLKCYADLRVTVPRGTAVTVEADSGHIDAREIMRALCTCKANLATSSSGSSAASGSCGRMPMLARSKSSRRTRVPSMRSRTPETSSSTYSAARPAAS